MKKMTLLIPFVSLFILQFFTLQVTHADIKGTYPIEVVSQSPFVRLYQIAIENHNHQQVLKGRITRLSRNANIALGHIEVVFKNSKNQLIDTKVVNYSPSSLSKHSRFWSVFNLVLPNHLPMGSTIQIKWHRNHRAT